MSDVTSIPLNKLVAWDGNVRKTAGTDTSLHELASSIAAHGLINNLVVKPHKKDTYAVITDGLRCVSPRERSGSAIRRLTPGRTPSSRLGQRCVALRC